jgi:hypothetical protein
MMYRGTARCQLWLAAIFLCHLLPLQQTFAQSDSAANVPRVADRSTKGALELSLPDPRSEVQSAESQAREIAFR